MKTVAIIISLFICTCTHAQGIKDTIFFNNGSVVIGKIKKVKLGIVTFDPDDAPDITVQLRKLKTIAGGNRVYRIETALHNLYFGTILPHPRINTIYVKTDTRFHNT